MTAKEFNTTGKTVYKWLARYEKSNYAGLDDYSKIPKRSPKEIPQEIKDKVIAAKKIYKSSGADKLKFLLT